MATSLLANGTKLNGPAEIKKKDRVSPALLPQASRLACDSSGVCLLHSLDLSGGEVPAGSLRVLRASEVLAEERPDERLCDLRGVVSTGEARCELRRRERLRCICHVYHLLSRVGVFINVNVVYHTRRSGRTHRRRVYKLFTYCMLHILQSVVRDGNSSSRWQQLSVVATTPHPPPGFSQSAG